jgi:hypothetical protein
MGNLKNLLVYIRYTHDFDGDCKTSSKVQIDNSLELGWKKEDIVVVTNFPWEYNGVKAIVVGDEHWYAERPRSIKTAIVPFLIDEGIIEKGKLYWNHDFDAYQLNPFDESELELEDFDAGLTDYGWQERWCMGSYFVKTSSRDIFEKAKPIIYQNIEDETAMVQLTTEDQSINKRCKRLNISYNFGMRNVEANWERAIKPLRVVHFHPYYKWVPTLDIFMYGKNGLNMPLIDERFTKLLNNHGVK